MTMGDLNTFDAQMVLCTEDCTKSVYGVWGTGVYAWISSVCKAIMHSGSYTKYEGDMFFAQVIPHKSLLQTFTGSTQNNINSKSLRTQMKGFTV